MGQGEMFWWLCNENCGILLPFFFFTLSWSVTNVCHGTTSRVKYAGVELRVGVGGELEGIIRSYNHHFQAGSRTVWRCDSSLTVAFVLPETVVTITLALNYCALTVVG